MTKPWPSQAASSCKRNNIFNISILIVNFPFTTRDLVAFLTDSPYRTLISESVLRLQESGFMRDLKDKWWKVQGDKKCEVNVQRKPK